MSKIESIFLTLNKTAYLKGINYSLFNFKKALKLVNNPHQKLSNIIQIAGTNGKGSTLTYIASALVNNNFRVATYTSPHLFNYQERIAINFKEISEVDFLNNYQYLEKKLGEHIDQLTEFEILTLIALLYFKNQKPDFVILETGLGGRLDATNVVKPILSIITRVDYDHEAILGDTLKKICLEKAGIIKKNIPVITINQKKVIRDIFNRIASKRKAPLYIAQKVKKIPSAYLMNSFYQRENLALSRKALKLINDFVKLDYKKSAKGLMNAQIIARYQKFKINNKTIILDGAHNPNGIKALIASLKQEFPNSKPTFIVGILKTKNSKSMLENILGYADSVYFVDFWPDYSYSYNEIKIDFPCINKFAFGDLLPDGELLIITGSIYFLNNFCKIYKFLPS